MLALAPASRGRLRAGRVACALIVAATLWVLAAGTASAVVVPVPYELGFGADHGGLPDGRGTGTGFTNVDPPRTGGGFEPSRLLTGDGELRIATAPGISYLQDNSLENALAVGVPAAAGVFSIATTIDRPPRGTGNWEQGGVWLGVDQDNYLKLVVISNRGRIGVQLLGEAGGRSASASPGALFARRFVAVRDLDRQRVTLVMRADAKAGTVAGFYAVDGGELRHVATFVPPPHVLTGGARVDTRLEGGRLAGVFASHRLGPGPVEYRFDRFEVACHSDGCPRSAPDPGPGGPAENVIEPEEGVAEGELRSIMITGAEGSLRVTLRHPRRVRLSGLVARGLPVALRCSHRCSMYARVRGSGVPLGGGSARTADAGLVRTRLTVFPRRKGLLRRVQPRRLAIRVTVRSGHGRRVRLRSSVRVRP